MDASASPGSSTGVRGLKKRSLTLVNQSIPVFTEWSMKISSCNGVLLKVISLLHHAVTAQTGHQEVMCGHQLTLGASCVESQQRNLLSWRQILIKGSHNSSYIWSCPQHSVIDNLVRKENFHFLKKSCLAWSSAMWNLFLCLLFVLFVP